MTFDSLFILGSIWTTIFYVLGVVILFLSGLILVAAILLQDSKEGGLGGAFGGGGGGDSFLGAKAQRGITRFTAGLGIFFACLLLLLGKIDTPGTEEQRDLPGDPGTPALQAPADEETALAPETPQEEEPAAVAGGAPGESTAAEPEKPAEGETKDPVAEILGELMPEPEKPAEKETKDPVAEILGELMPERPAEKDLPPSPEDVDTPEETEIPEDVDTPEETEPSKDMPRPEAPASGEEPVDAE
ncbi:MAG: preprotein translocase subunit SecG [Planctomycetes bacterium]|nr:preprotein translocase subunit SecG [Planctomycetota bacterium]